MALIFCDSFDHYATANILQKWEVDSLAAVVSAVTPRTGSQCLSITGAFGPIKIFSARTTLIVGSAILVNILPGVGTGGLFSLRDQTAGSIQVYIGVSPLGEVTAHRGNVAVLLCSSAVGIITPGAYNYIEARVFFSETLGTVEIRVNGVLVASAINVDTCNTANTFATSVQLLSLGGAGNYRHDDVYILDTLGGVNDNFLGPVKIYLGLPVSDSAPLAWTPSTGSDHFALVDEVPPNTTDYNFSGAIGAQDQYLYSASGLVPAGSSVLGIQHVMDAALDAAGALSIASCVNGVVAVPDTALSTSYTMIETPYDTKPGGGAWVLADVTSTAFGPAVTA